MVEANGLWPATRDGAVAEFVIFTSNEYLVFNDARCLRSKRAAILHAGLAQIFWTNSRAAICNPEFHWLRKSIYMCLGKKSLSAPVWTNMRRCVWGPPCSWFVRQADTCSAAIVGRMKLGGKKIKSKNSTHEQHVFLIRTLQLGRFITSLQTLA